MQPTMGPHSLTLSARHPAAASPRFYAARPLALLLLMLAQLPPPLASYRILDPDAPLNATPPAAFRPYDRGFVGRVANPASARPWRVNPGGPWSHAKPNVFRGVLPRQNCSAMVGPVGGVYFCSSEAAGYCDRRSGACFCSAGYSGADCGACRPTHTRDPATRACVPRVQCPGGCSGAGACDSATGACACEPGRRGVDCSLHTCRLLHRWCTSCNATACLACEQGYFWASGGGAGGGPPGCEPCTRFDPRCAECTEAGGCSACADPLLRGAARSGRRRVDPPLPWDEDARGVGGGGSGAGAGFGSQDAAFFRGAEAFFLAASGEQAAAAGVTRGAWSPWAACAKARAANASVGTVRVAVSALGSAGGAGLGGDRLPEVYAIDCSLPGWETRGMGGGGGSGADYFYGYGPDGWGAEGPVRGAAYGSPQSPIVYPPGVASVDAGSGAVDVFGELPLDTRVVDMTVELLLDAVVLAQALSNASAPRNTSAHPWLLGGVWPLTSPAGGLRGYDPRRYPDYDGYQRDSVRGWLLSNETGQANAWNHTHPPHLVCVPGDVEGLGRGAAPVCFLGAGAALPAEEELRPGTPWVYYLPPHYATRLRALADAGRAGAAAAEAQQRRRRLGPQAATTLPVLSAGGGGLRGGASGGSNSSSFGARSVPGPLTDTAFACEEGADGSWACAPTPQSHAACGHAGTFSFSSPHYVAVEGWGEGWTGVTVRRSGGGLGRAEVLLTLRHGTTDDSDVRLGGGWAPAAGGGARRLLFEEGVVALTVRVTVFDDKLVEPGGGGRRRGGCPRRPGTRPSSPWRPPRCTCWTPPRARPTWRRWRPRAARRQQRRCLRLSPSPRPPRRRAGCWPSTAGRAGGSGGGTASCAGAARPTAAGLRRGGCPRTWLPLLPRVAGAPPSARCGP